MAEHSIHTGEGFGIVVMAAALALLLVYPLVQMVAKIFGITI
jgi:hypothetical protein